jgi:hypothetical protein
MRSYHAVIIDQNDRPSILEYWTEEYLIDKIFWELAGTNRTAIAQNPFSRKYMTVTEYKYYNQARELRKYIPVAMPIPRFKIYLSDLSTRLVAELRCLKNPEYVLKEAVGRIFENIDERQYHQSIARKLKVELVK